MTEELYPNYDYNSVQDNKPSLSPTLKAVRSIVAPGTEGKNTYTGEVEDLHSVVRKQRNEDNKAVLNSSVLRGPDFVQGLLDASIREQQQAAPTTHDKLVDVSRTAFEYVSAPAPTAPATKAAVAEKNAGKLALNVVIQEAIENLKMADTIGGFAMNIIPGVGVGQGLKLEEFVRSKVPNLPANQAREEDLTALRNHMLGMSEHEQAAIVDEMVNTLSSGVGSKLFAVDILNKLIDPGTKLTQQVDNLFDNMSPVFDVLDAAGIGKGIQTARAVRALTKLKQATNESRLLAEAGRKDIINSDATTAVANGAETSGLGLTRKELAGRSTSLNIDSVMPSGLTTDTAGMQKAIISKTEKLINDLNDVVKNKGHKAEEARALIDEIKSQYSPAVNKTISHAEFDVTDTNVVATLIRKPADSSVFLTKEAAEGWAKRNAVGKWEVVPDTTNSGFVLREELKARLLADKAAVEAKLATVVEQKPKRVRKTKKTTDTAEPITTGTEFAKLPKDLGGAKPTYQAFKLKFETDFDKAAYTIAQDTKSARDSDYVAWLSAQAPGKTIEELRAYGNAVKRGIKSEASSGAYAPGETITVRTPKVQASPSAGDVSQYHLENWSNVDAGRVNSEALSFAIDEGAPGEFIRGTNVTYTKSIGNSPALEFHLKLSKKLGLENQQLVLMTRNDLLTSSEPNLKEFAKRMYEGMNRPYGIYVKLDDGRHVILMNIDPTDSAHFLDVFAHEYGHFFHDVWHRKYNGVIQTAFNNWLFAKKSKLISTATSRKLVLNNFQDWMEYRSFGTWRSVSGWFSSGTMDEKAIAAAKKSLMKGNEEWSAEYSEFFAEQFSKWAFTDEVPTTALGMFMKDFINGIKEIAQYAIDILKSDAKYGNFDSLTMDANADIAKFLNRHIKSIEEGKLIPPGTNMHEGPAVKASARSTAEELASIEEQLKAISDAESSASHGWLVRETVSNPITLERLVKGFDRDDINSMAYIAIDPSLGASELVYNNRVVGVHRESRIKKLLTEFTEAPISALSSKERKRLASLLIEGDAEGKEFSTVELLGRGLSPKEQEAYLSVRAARNIMHSMRDAEAVKSLTMKGYTTVSSGDLKMFGKEMEVVEVLGKRVWNHTLSRYELVTDTYDLAGDRLFRAFDRIAVDGSREARFIRLPSSGLYTDSITSVIPYRRGEFKRIYDDEYFVKVGYKANIDDAVEDAEFAYKTARSRREATDYVNAFNEAVRLRQVGRLTREAVATLMQPFDESVDEFMAMLDNLGDDTVARVNYDRQQDDYIKDFTSFAQGTNGFTRTRGTALGKVYKEDVSNTLRPLDSIQSEITNTARVASVTEWRDGAIQRWYNEFADLLTPAQRAMQPDEAFYDWSNNASRGIFIGDDKRIEFAHRTAKYVRQQLGMQTKEEQLYKGMSIKLSQMMEGDNGRFETVGRLLRKSDALTFLRTVNFHTMLGMLNPSQIFVQGLNMVNAILISPVFGSIAAKNAIPLRLALMSDNEDVWKTMAKVAQLGLGDTDDFVETVRALRRSGLLDNILGSSLYNIEDGKYSIWSRRAGNVSAFFFNRGEEMSRITTFDVARREFMRDNPGVAWFTDDALGKIIARQDDLTQNMTKANLAAFQRGLLSIPTQFIGYQLKFAANIITSATGNKRAFTQKEVASLVAGHLLVFGIANNGMPDFVEEAVANKMEELGWTKEKRLYVTQGIVAGLIGSISDSQVELAVGARFNTFDWYKEFVYTLVSGEKNALELVLGPTSYSAARLGGLGKLMQLWVRDEDRGLDTIVDSLHIIGSTGITSLSNLDKVYVAMNNYNYIHSKSLDPTVKASSAELMFQALGIPPAAKADLDKIYSSKKEHTERLKRLADEYKQYMFWAAQAMNKGDDAGAQRYVNMMNAVVRGMNVYDYNTVLAASRDGFKESKLHKELTEMVLKDFQGRTPLTTNVNPNEVK